MQGSEILGRFLLWDPLHPLWSSLCPFSLPLFQSWGLTRQVERGTLGSTSGPASTIVPKGTRQMHTAELSKCHRGGVGGRKSFQLGTREIGEVFLEGSAELRGCTLEGSKSQQQRFLGGRPRGGRAQGRQPGEVCSPARATAKEAGREEPVSRAQATGPEQQRVPGKQPIDHLRTPFAPQPWYFPVVWPQASPFSSPGLDVQEEGIKDPLVV